MLKQTQRGVYSFGVEISIGFMVVIVFLDSEGTKRNSEIKGSPRW